MQFLDPKLNGMKAQGCRLTLLAGRNLSGLKLSTSGPQIFLHLCMTKGSIAHPTPAGTVQFAENVK